MIEIAEILALANSLPDPAPKVEPEPVESERTFSYGEFFINSAQPKDIYILAMLEDESDKSMIALISLSTGNRWTDPIWVPNAAAVTVPELKVLFASGTFIHATPAKAAQLFSKKHSK